MRYLSAHRLFASSRGATAAPQSSPAPASTAPRFKSARGLSLVEVVFATGILTMVCLGVLQAMLQSRRMTEGSVRQASVNSLVQGYMEQIKALKYAADASNDLPSSPATSPGTSAADWNNYTSGEFGIPPTLTAKNALQETTTIYLASGNAPETSSTASLPTNVSKHSERVDIDNMSSDRDDTVLDMWVWINDLTDTTRPNVQKCKKITIVYQYTVRDGGRIRYFTDSMRAIRSIVPTD
jgi:Tfp pilus assembly protein PilV